MAAGGQIGFDEACPSASEMSAIFPCDDSIGRGTLLAKDGTSRGMSVPQHLGRLLAVACIVAIEPQAALPLQLQRAKDQAAPTAFIEQGKFLLHKFEQPIGEETYQIAPDGDGFTVAMNFKFTDRGKDVPLSATFHGSADFSPRTFEIKGKTSRLSDIDQAVEIGAGRARIRSDALLQHSELFDASVRYNLPARLGWREADGIVNMMVAIASALREP
jgi:hypothetical protein